MELKDAFEMIVNTINEKFKEGVYDLQTANEVIRSVNVVGQALSATKPVESVDKVEDTTEDIPLKKVTRKK